jgi:tetratricopeptide (TPR) repeat protein
LAILEVLFDIDQPLTGSTNEGLLFKLWRGSGAVAAQSPAVTGEPIIYVEPVTATGQPIPDVQSPRMIRERLFDALARYDDVEVISDPPTHEAASALRSNFYRTPASIYRLISTVNYYPDGDIAFGVRLIDMADGTVAWAKTYEFDYKPDPAHKKGHISRDIAQTLLQQFGIIQAREAIKRAGTDAMQDPYHCILGANAYLRSFDPSLYRPARECLEHATADKRPLVSVFVKLARLYFRDYQFGGISRQPGDRSTLDRAYQAAARAIDIKPNSAAAQFAMQDILLTRGDIEHAKVAGDNALSLNPYDNAVIYGHASFLILTGQIDAGLAILHENTSRKTAVWTGHHFLLALASYLKDDLATAETEAGQIADENFPPGLMLDAIVATKNQNCLRAQRGIQKLYQKFPSWRRDFRANIGYFLPDHDMAARFGRDFAAAADDLEKHAEDIVSSVEPTERR